ncbi:unnamed protein product [Mytilus edulis]|uniref:Uncharacterized protein n=1 Tax=Mytilus edulis TaxID=6550 RepID=A0A8S3SPD5_MYTED|nr:unnamed protein product [Mytilus edulis]
MAYKSQCDELSRNITILKEHDAALESRQDQLASDLIKQGDISSKTEDIIKTIVTDLKIKHGEAIRILDERMNNLHIHLDGMSKLLYSQQSTIPRNVKVAGNAGCGKTAFIRHLALRLMSDGYEIVPVIEPKTIVEYHDETKNKFSSRSLQTVADEELAPLITKSENDLNDLDTFFQTPIQVIESEIKSMRIDSPVSYCVLVLCLLFNGKLPKHDIFFSNKYKSLLKDCYSVCGLNRGTPIKTLSDIAKSLTGVYLNEVDVKDKEGDRHQKLRLKLIDVWVEIIDQKPAKIDVHSFLDLIVINAFQWLLGKGLFDIIMLLERRLCSDVHNEVSNADSSSKFIAILGGNVKTYSWICQVQKGMLWQYVSNTLFINKYCIQDFQWALIAGQTNIVEFLLNNEICKNCINESITFHDMNLIRAKLFGLSDYTTRIILFWLKVELQCSKFPLPKNIIEDLYGNMKDRKTYLAYASILGHESIVDLLLRNGANPNEISLRSNNIAKSSTVLPVVYASMYGRLQILQRLLKNGAEFESTGPKGCTLLMFASSYGHYDVAKFLLNENVDINATNMFQNTALLYASKKDIQILYIYFLKMELSRMLYVTSHQRL